MPWRVENTPDFIVLLENLLRAVLIGMVLARIFFTSANTRKLLLFIFLSYLAHEAAWSLGTVNWGTALRHHVPGLGLLIAGALADSKGKQNFPFYLISKRA